MIDVLYFQELLVAEEKIPYYRKHPEELFGKVYYFFARDFRMGKIETLEGLADPLSN